MGIVCIIGGVAQVIQQVLGIGDVVIVQLSQQPLFQHPLHNVLGGEAHVKGTGGGFYLHHHVFIGGEAHVVDLNAGFLFELLDHVFINVVHPVEDVYHLIGQCANGEEQGQRQQQSNHFFHGTSSFFNVDDFTWRSLHHSTGRCKWPGKQSPGREWFRTGQQRHPRDSSRCCWRNLRPSVQWRQHWERNT